MLDKWQKKEKPVFTGITRGIGGFGFGGSGGAGGDDASGPISASGGTKSPTSRSGYIVHTFQHPDTSSFTPDTSQTFEVTGGSGDIEILCVGGGGGGAHLGGGGGGGLIYKTGITIGPGTYPITVGAGGEHGTWNTPKPMGSPGGLSRVHGLPIPGAAYGGGGGAQGSNNAPDPSRGLDGGAGGGGNAADDPNHGGFGGKGLNPSNPSIFPSFPLYEPGDTQGYPGGNGQPSSHLTGGGGGGSGSAGEAPPQGRAGNGTSNSITGSAVVYSGGGGGGAYGSNPGADRPQSLPPSGNGGAGVTAHHPSNPGTAHRGGGGGGAGSIPHSGSPHGGGHGGPGIVIIAYQAP